MLGSGSRLPRRSDFCRAGVDWREDLAGGDAMSDRNDDTPELFMLALWFCLSLAFFGWIVEVVAW